MKTKEPPCTERYARWCERSVAEISDIMMPEIDGFELAENIRRVNKQIPILFMSAKDDLPSKQKGFTLGVDDYMVKPVELGELLLRVRHCFEEQI